MSNQIKPFSQILLFQMLTNDSYLKAVIPFIKSEYFTDTSEKIVFDAISDHVTKYKTPPQRDEILLALSNKKGISEDQFKEAGTIVVNAYKDKSKYTEKWLWDESEKFCQDQSMYNAIMDSIQIINGKSEKQDKSAVVSLVKDALSVSFDTNIGHDYFGDAESRFEFYRNVEEKIDFHLDMFNKATNGGVPNKTLNVPLASTGTGKTLFCCDHSAHLIQKGKNVLYITLEMSEEWISKRIDANLMNFDINDLDKVPAETYAKKIATLRKKFSGNLKVKQYPATNCNVNHINALIDDLEMKKGFVPDVLIVDYIGLMGSVRYRHGTNANSYTIVKSIAEELRGLAVERDIQVWAPHQTNRQGDGNTDVTLSETADSYGLPQTADLMFVMMTNEVLEQSGQYAIKILKSRYNAKGTYQKFNIGVDYQHMRLHDVSSTAAVTPQQAQSNTGTNSNDGRRDAYSKFKFG